jgi:hypothetical protein
MIDVANKWDEGEMKRCIGESRTTYEAAH